MKHEIFIVFGEPGVGEILLIEHIDALIALKSIPLRTANQRKELEKVFLMVDDGREVALSASLDLIGRLIINRPLGRTNGCQSGAARMLGLSKRSLHRQIQNSIEW